MSYLLQQQIYTLASNLAEMNGNCAKLRPCSATDRIAVVTDDADILWNTQSSGMAGVYRTDSYLIVGAVNGSWQLVLVKKLIHGSKTARNSVSRMADPFGTRFAAELFYCAEKALIAFSPDTGICH